MTESLEAFTSHDSDWSKIMNVGMLWLDDDKRTTFEEKIGQAADFYQEKFGVAPDMCLVNVGMLKAELHVGSIHVCPVRNVLPNHFWIGNDQAKRPS